MNQIIRWLVCGIILSGFAGSAAGDGFMERIPPFHSMSLDGGEVIERDVPYVPTPPEVVHKMLSMAGVDENDRVFDLGCGDGRIVIAAAKERGARGVGIDIDPERIRESRENATIAGVTDRVSFLRQDLFTTDLSDATVLAIYLLPSVNLELRPKILKELKPGTRIVSHDFDMGEWEPDRSATVDGHEIYFWVVPANVGGSWEWTGGGPDGSARCRLELQQEFQMVDGSLDEGNGSVPVEHASLIGDKLEFTAERRVNGRSVPVRYEGKIRENRLYGRCIEVRENFENAAKWEAKRNPSTVSPLDSPAPPRDMLMNAGGGGM